ncbi:hypothetical protein D9M68_924710 [compost metagenome]
MCSKVYEDKAAFTTSSDTNRPLRLWAAAVMRAVRSFTTEMSPPRRLMQSRTCLAWMRVWSRWARMRSFSTG